MLECKNLEVRIQNTNTNKLIFSQLNFKAYPGEIMMVLGKNGTGKSTLLKTLVGQVPANCGTLRVYDQEWSASRNSRPANLFAFVVQNQEQGTLRDFSVLENLCFALGKNKRLSFLKAGVSKAKMQKIGDFLKTYAPGFLDRLDQPTSSLSGGQRQLLGILMNMMSDAKVLLLDEPTAALDDSATEDLMKQLRKWVQERKLITLMVCHDSDLVARYADRILELGAPNQVSV